MSNSRVALRYAKSLFDLAGEQGKVEAIYGDMKLIQDTCAQNRDLVLLFNSPIVTTDSKKSIVESIFKPSVDAVTLAFLNIILTKHREHYIPAIAAEFVELYKVHKGIVTAFVTTATKLDAESRDKMVALVAKKTGKEVELVEKVDEDIMGGFVLRFGDTQIDTSVSGKLRDLRNAFDDNLYVKEY